MKKTGLFLALIIVLGGCTTSPLALKVLYGQFDNVMKRELLSYADFSDVEQQAIKDEVDKLVTWHRYQALPDYVELLSEAQSRLLDSTARDQDIEWLFQSGKDLAQDFEVRSPVLTLRPLIANLDDQQIDQIIEKIDEELAEDREELEEVASKPEDEAVKNLTKFFKRLGVKLNDSQQQMARNYFEQRSLSNLQRHAAWEVWAAELAPILRNRQSAKFSAQFESHYTARFSRIENTYPEAWQSDQTIYRNLFRDLFNSLNEAQKQSMRDRLASLSAVAMDLASRD